MDKAKVVKEAVEHAKRTTQGDAFGMRRVVWLSSGPGQPEIEFVRVDVRDASLSHAVDAAFEAGKATLSTDMETAMNVILRRQVDLNAKVAEAEARATAAEERAGKMRVALSQVLGLVHEKEGAWEAARDALAANEEDAAGGGA